MIVLFTFSGIEEIHEEADYPGYRVSIEAVLDKTRQTIKVNITTGILSRQGKSNITSN